MNATNTGARIPSGAHRRRNPLTGEWVLVAAGRDKRPWKGQTEPASRPSVPSHDPDCYLCPGNRRVGEALNPEYDSTFVFTNDFAALRPDGDTGTSDADPLFTADSVGGTCRVICYSGRHDLSLADMTHTELRDVVDLWRDQHAELSADWPWVQVFENRGAAMGASSPHPHGQIWAGAAIPTTIDIEQRHQQRHFERHGVALLAEYAAREVELAERVVTANDDWVVMVPYWATWPFETLMISLTGARGFSDLTSRQSASLAAALGSLLSGYDALFSAPFPYSMGWHPSPKPSSPSWVMHAHFYPPLLRADARKFLVGYELLAEAQRDITPEDAAARLREAVASCPRQPAGAAQPHPLPFSQQPINPL